MADLSTEPAATAGTRRLVERSLPVGAGRLMRCVGCGALIFDTPDDPCPGLCTGCFEEVLIAVDRLVQTDLPPVVAAGGVFYWLERAGCPRQVLWSAVAETLAP